MKENNVVTSETKDALSFWSLSHTAASSSHPCDRASCRWSPRLPCSCSPLAALELYVNKTTIIAIILLILRSFQRKGLCNSGLKAKSTTFECC